MRDLFALRRLCFAARFPLILTFAVTVIMTGADIAFAANGSVVYTYDALGRIATASYDTGVFVIYSYDANGNRLSQKVNVNTTTLQWTASSGACTSNCWGGALW